MRTINVGSALQRTRPIRAAMVVACSAVVVAFSLLPSALAPVAGAAAAPTPNGNWKTLIQMQNQTKNFEFRLLDSTKTEMTNWNRRARDTIAPGVGTESEIENTPEAFGHGLAQILTWGIYRDNAYVGMFGVTNGIDCDYGALGVCLGSTKWQNTWQSPLAGRFAGTQLRFEVHPGPPDGNVNSTVFLVSIEGVESGAPATGTMPADDTSVGSTAPPPAKDVTGANWGWIQDISNRTPYTLKLGWNWNSQGTNYLRGLPATINSGQTAQYLYQNGTTFHGPQAFAVYNAYEPTTNAYVGSTVVEAQTDCEAGVKVPDIPATCISWRPASFSVAASFADTKGDLDYAMDAHSDTSGLPPLSLRAQTDITLRGTPTPTPTTLPGQTIDCNADSSVNAIIVKEKVPINNIPVCTSTGNPLPTITLKSPAGWGFILKRYPTPTSSQVVLSGKASFAAGFELQVEASAPGFSKTVDIFVNATECHDPSCRSLANGST